MSWFDASTFSKYAKTALKQAQKNIDKVLDINEEDNSITKISNTGSDVTVPTDIISTPKSPTYVDPETDSFFNSFLGGDIKKQVSSYLSPTEKTDNATIESDDKNIVKLSPRRGKLIDRSKLGKSISANSPTTKSSSTNDVASIDVGSTAAVDTPRRKGRLKDRKTKLNNADLSSDGSDCSKTDVKNVSLTQGQQNEAVDALLSSTKSNAITPDLKSNVSDSAKNDTFDDIDLTDSDVDINDISSNLSEDILSTSFQHSSPTKQKYDTDLLKGVPEDGGLLSKLNKTEDDLDLDKIIDSSEIGIDQGFLNTKNIEEKNIRPEKDTEEENIDSEKDNMEENISPEKDTVEKNIRPEKDTVEKNIRPEKDTEENINSEKDSKEENISPEKDDTIPEKDSEINNEHKDDCLVSSDQETKSPSLLSAENKIPENEINESQPKDDDNVILKSEELVESKSSGSDVRFIKVQTDDASDKKTETCTISTENEWEASSGWVADGWGGGNDDIVEIKGATDVTIDNIDKGTPDSIDKSHVKDISNGTNIKTDDLLDALDERNNISTSQSPASDNTSTLQTQIAEEFISSKENSALRTKEWIDANHPSEDSLPLSVITDLSLPVDNSVGVTDSVEQTNDLKSNDLKYNSNFDAGNKETINQELIAQSEPSENIEEVSKVKDVTIEENDTIHYDGTSMNLKTPLHNKHLPSSVTAEQVTDQVENLLSMAESQLWSAEKTGVIAETPYKELPQSPYFSEEISYNNKEKTNEGQSNHACTPTDESNRYHIEEVNKLNEKISSLSQEVVQLQSVIEAREMKMVELSKENISYQESISVYQSQIEQLEQINAEDDGEMEEMRQEFMTRIAEVDNKCHSALKERDEAKARLIEVEASLRQSTNEQVSVLTNSLLEKEETIKDLLNEGEALSKKELEANQRIKKLRIKLKEVTNTNTSQTEKITGLESEIQKLKDALKDKEDNEVKLNNEIKKLEGITDSQEDEVSELKEKLDDMEEKYKAMETTLHNTYGEINRLNLENAQKESAVQETTNAREEKKVLEEKLKELERNSKFGKEELLIQLEDLQLAYSRLEQQLGRREDELKKEIEDLHKRLEHGEHRNQELSQSVSAATKPLLRQIGNLQSNFTIQSESWERIEKNLTDRLVSLQDQLALAVEKERMASEVAIEAKAKLKAVQSQQNSIKEEKFSLQQSLEIEFNKSKEIESEWKREKSNYVSKLSNLKVVTMELEGEKKVLEEQLTAERVKYENETHRLSAQISLQQQRQTQQQSHQSANPSGRHSRSSSRSSIAGELDTMSQQDSSPIPLQRYLSSSSSYHDGFQKGSTTTAASMEHLRSQLRSREGEVFVLQEEIKTLEKTKASLAQELVTLANRVEELETSHKDVELLKEEYKDLKSRHDAVLQMYGEKAEEAEELKMDIEDVKNMYRQQIQELCGGR